MANKKIYTEEQVREILKSTHIHTDNDVNMILKQFTPIELPSDEEIEINGVNQWDGYKQSNYLSAFTDGAKWMRNKILNQNK